MPISEISKHLPEYCPPLSTIYRRLKNYNIEKPSQARKNFERDVFKAGSNDMNDKDRHKAIRKIREEMIEDAITRIRRKAERHKEIIE